MKYLKITVIAALLTVTAGFQSCDLDEYNPSGATADAIFTTKAGMEGLVNSIYFNFRWKYYGREDPVLYMEGGTDLWYNYGLVGYGNALTQYLNLDWGQGQLKTLWERQYDIINLCNTGINRLPEVDYGSDAYLKPCREGEFRFMRAYCYWWLVEFFGGVVARTEETSTVELTADRTAPADIYDQIILPDLQLACQLLEAEPIDGMVGRATKKAAYGALARAALSRAAYGDAETYNQMALDAAKELIENPSAYKTRLYDNYEEIFAYQNNKTNEEALFVVTYDRTSTYNPDSNPNRLINYFNPIYNQVCGMSLEMAYGGSPNFSINNTCSMMPTRYLLELFDEGDMRYDVSFLEAFIQNNPEGWVWSKDMVDAFAKPASFEGNVSIQYGDTALLHTRKVIPQSVKDSAPYAIADINDVYDAQTGVIKGAEWARFFPKLHKYIDLGRATTSSPSTNDVIVIRLAEMYLIAAEASIGLGRTTEAAQYINALRKRAVRPGYEDRMTVSAADMTVEFILEERARELCGEHMRWFDLKRTGKLVENIKKYNPTITQIQNHHILRPIPQSFLQSILNAEEFGQNPGYTQPGSLFQ